MDEDSLADALAASDYYSSGNVGPQNNGTYSVPSNAQPVNQQWDTGGGSLGQYGNQVFGILRDGIGAWSANKRNEQFLDYQRYEATQGGVFRQGAPNQQYTGTVAARTNIDPMMLILMVGAAVLLLRR